MVVHQDVRVPAGVGDDVKPILELTRELTLPPLREAVARLHPDLARISGYHMGWCDPDGVPTGRSPGKLVRAALVLMSARAFGADPAVAVPCAVAVELTHSFSLLHDDIMDGDELRRGRPAAWVVYGPGRAVLAGDGLMGRAFGILGELPAEQALRAHEILVDALNGIIHGQAADLALEQCGVDDVTLADYLESCEKTSGLLGGCSALGALLGGAPPDALGQLCRASAHLGLSWQMANDVENIWGDPAGTGKPAFGDLRQAKKTLPVVAALRSGTEPGARLAEAMATDDGTPQESELPARAGLIEQAGGRSAAERLSDERLDLALSLLDEAAPTASGREDIGVLFRFIRGGDSFAAQRRSAGS